MDIKKRFGLAVKEQRKRLNVPQEELAMRIGADQAYVSRIEAGIMNVTLETVEQIGIALGVEVDELIGPREGGDTES